MQRKHVAAASSQQPSGPSSAAAPAPELAAHHTHIVLFDGVCNLCDGFVNFCIDRDPSGKLSFGSLQSPAAGALLDKHKIPRDLSTIVYIENGVPFVRSTAVLRAIALFGGIWALLSAVLMLIPAPLRDVGYRFVASSRYTLFGQSDSCRLPSADVRARFIDP